MKYRVRSGCIPVSFPSNELVTFTSVSCYMNDARYEKTAFTSEDVCGLWSPFYLAQKVGASVGGGEILQ